jgi:hypothetical protein
MGLEQGGRSSARQVHTHQVTGRLLSLTTVTSTSHTAALFSIAITGTSLTSVIQRLRRLTGVGIAAVAGILLALLT